MRMLRSLCGGMLLLLLRPGALVDAFAPIHHQQLQPKTAAARRIPDVSLSMSNQLVDALLDINSYFKKGLKFVLLPQSAESGEVELNSFDSTKRFVNTQQQQQGGGVKVPQTAVDTTASTAPVSSSSQMMSETVGKAAKSVEHAAAKVAVPSSTPPVTADTTAVSSSSSSQLHDILVGKAAKSVDHAVAKVAPASPPPVVATADTSAVSSSSSQLHDILVGKAAKSVDQAKAVVTSASPAVPKADAPIISSSSSQMTASLPYTASAWSCSTSRCRSRR